MYNSFFTFREKRRFLFLSAGLIFNGVIEVFSIAAIIPFLTVAANPGLIQEKEYLKIIYDTLNFSSSRDFLFCLGLVLIFAIFLANFSNAFFTWFNLRFTWSINHNLSVRMIKKYMGMDYLSFIRRNSADLQRNIQTEVMEVATTVIGSILNCMNKGISLLLTVVFLVIIDPLLAAFIGVVFGLVYIGIFFFAKRTLSQIGLHSLEDNEAKFRATSEAFGVFKLAKLLHSESYFISQFEKASSRFSRNQAKRRIISQLPRFAVETIAFSIMIGISLYSIRVKPSFSEAIAIIGLYAFAAYRLMPKIQQLYTNFSVLRSGWPRVRYLQKELQFGSSQVDGRFEYRAKEPKSVNTKSKSFIEFRNVNFSYPNTKRPTIDDISFIIAEKTTVGFLGETGSGKTTIIDLILGIFPPDFGTILVDGKPIDNESLEAWQRSIGYVPQDIYLTDNSIAKNVAFGISENEIDMEKVQKACLLANVTDFIENELPEKYDTIVGERGVRLSGGQRQRIAIARALYHEPRLLVFDEATSALDSETERSVMEAVENISHEKSIILIAHRLTTLKKCDLVFKIDKGQIVKSGTLEETVGDISKF